MDFQVTRFGTKLLCYAYH